MLIIGHRGAKGLERENSIESLQAGVDAGADILEFDVRHTKDNIVVVIHDFHLLRTHQKIASVHGMSYAQLKALVGEKQVITLEEVLRRYFGEILLNIEVKSRGTGTLVAKLLKNRYIKKAADWDNVLISSFSGSELVKIRKYSPRANLALLHYDNPFIFIAFQRRLKLTAVGFHRLYINRLALEIAKKLKLFTYVYTVNRPGAIDLIETKNIDGIVTDYPDLFQKHVSTHPEISNT
jgi:glycerophosphoryl diester phosphodiesterase